MERTFWTVKDEIGILRPLAGIWLDADKESIAKYRKSHPEDTVIKVKLVELKQ